MMKNKKKGAKCKLLKVIAAKQEEVKPTKGGAAQKKNDSFLNLLFRSIILSILTLYLSNNEKRNVK